MADISGAQSDSQLDQLDLALIASLNGNVRKPTRKIADELDVSAPTIKRRIERLVGNDIISLSPVVDLDAAGYTYLLIIGIKVENRSPLRVAKKIATLPETLTVNVVLGHFDIEVVAALKTRNEVGLLLSEILPAIKGVASLVPALALDVWKFQSSCAPIVSSRNTNKKKLLEPLDLEIIECLHRDCRVSNRSVAAHLGISESSVRVRLKRMQEEKQVSLATAHRLQDSFTTAAFVGISVQGQPIASVCKALIKIPEVSFVCTTLGRHDIMCCVSVSELSTLTHVLHEGIVKITGVKSTEPSHCLQQIKHQLRLGLVL